MKVYESNYTDLERDFILNKTCKGLCHTFKKLETISVVIKILFVGRKQQIVVLEDKLRK